MAEFGEEAGGPDPHLSKNHLPLAIVSSESEKSLYLWEKYSHTKKKKTQLKSTLVSIHNLGEGISHRFNSYMKKTHNHSEADVSHFLLVLIFQVAAQLFGDCSIER